MTFAKGASGALGLKDNKIDGLIPPQRGNKRSCEGIVHHTLKIITRVQSMDSNPSRSRQMPIDQKMKLNFNTRGLYSIIASMKPQAG